MDGTDYDWYRVSGMKGKSFSVVVENQSPTLWPSIRIHNTDKSIAKDWTTTNTSGADLTVTLPDAEPDKDYFVVVAPHSSQSAGNYKLSTR